MDEPPYNNLPLDERGAAAYLGFTTSALKMWRRLGRGPAYVRVGRTIRYLPEDLEAFQQAHRIEPRLVTK